MRTEDLIAELASRAKPVRPLPSPAWRALAWLVLALFSAGAGILAYGTRPDLGTFMAQRDFVWTAALAAITIATTASAALVLAVPAAERSPALRLTGVGLVALWAGVVISAIVHTGYGLSQISDWYVCFVRVISIGLIPGIVLFGMLRRARPLRLAWTSGLATVATMATGAVAIQFVCPVSDPGHALLGHLGPVVAMGVIGAAAAKRLLRPDEPFSTRQNSGPAR